MLIATIMITQWMASQIYEETSKLSHSYKATRTTMVDINNKYGSVIVSVWEKDSVKIEITRKISEKNRDRFEKIRDNIDFKFTDLPNYVGATTLLGEKHATIIQNVKEATNYLSASESGTEINYKVYLPGYITLKIVNKYGDIALPDLSGVITVDLSNGNFQSRNLSGVVNLNLAFGDAQIKQIKQGTVALNYQNINISQADKITINTKSSNLMMDKVTQCTLNSRRDVITFNWCQELTADCYFTKLSVNQLTSTGQVKMTYGEMTKLVLSREFKRFEMVGQSCDVQLSINQPQAYNAQIKATSSTYTLPAGLNSTIGNYKTLITTQPVKFTYQKQLSEDKLKINISGGDLKINHQ